MSLPLTPRLGSLADLTAPDRDAAHEADPFQPRAVAPVGPDNEMSPSCAGPTGFSNLAGRGWSLM